MNRLTGLRRVAGSVALISTAFFASGLRAEEPEHDTLSLKIAKALRSDRLFMRAGAILVNIKTKSGATYDVTGPVIKASEVQRVFFNDTSADFDTATAELNEIIQKYPGIFEGTELLPIDALYETFSRNLDTTTSPPQSYGKLLNPQQGLPLLTNYLATNGMDGIGTPPGITGKAASSAGTAGLSIGYFLDDDHKWVVETYVLAAPVSTSVNIHGMRPVVQTGAVVLDENGNPEMAPIAIDGQKIITSKLIPPVLMLGKYWGSKDAAFRPYTGVMGMYAIFTDTKATDVLNAYVGGSNPGDTTVSLKNAFGMGPVLGMKYRFNDHWHASLNVGHVKLKTQATITTRNTFIGNGAAILNDLGGVSAVIQAGEAVYNQPAGTCQSDYQIACAVVRNNGGLVSLITKGVIADRFAAGQGDGRTLGTYVRKTDTELTNTILMMSVGRSF